MSLISQLKQMIAEEEKATAGSLYNYNPVEAAGKKKRAPKKSTVPMIPVASLSDDVLIAGKKKRAPKKVAVVVEPVPIVTVEPVMAGKSKKKRGPMSDETKAKMAGSAWNQEVKDMQKKHGVSLKEAMSLASQARKEKK